MNPHAAVTQVEVAFAGGTHATHDEPHVAMLASDSHVLPQRWKPVRHTKPQFVPSQVADALAGAVHGVHEVPQDEALVLLTHVPVQLWKLALHAVPQVAAAHVGVPFATIGQPVQVPQCSGSVARFASQPFAGLLSQSENPSEHVNPHVPEVQFAVAFGGVGHAVPHVPHVAVVSRRASQPFATLPSQLPNPALQFNSEQAPLTHEPVAFANEHDVPQTPQLVTVTLVLVSQPFVPSPSQLPKPGRHGPIAQVPLAQVAPAFENVH